MKFTILNGGEGDDTVSVNGRPIFFVVDSLLPDPSIWAVQWYGNKGEIEYSDGKPNVEITSYSEFQPILDEWEKQKAVEDAPPPPPIQEGRIRRLERQIQNRLDSFAGTRNYDSILSAASYVNSTNAKFAAEGKYCVELRDATWATAYQILYDVLEGARPEPESIEDIESELPTMQWPA